MATFMNRKLAMAVLNNILIFKNAYFVFFMKAAGGIASDSLDQTSYIYKAPACYEQWG
jgi:hypothetical protein